MGGIHSSVGTDGAGLDWTAGLFVSGHSEHKYTNDDQKYMLKSYYEEQLPIVARGPQLIHGAPLNPQVHSCHCISPTNAMFIFNLYFECLCDWTVKTELTSRGPPLVGVAKPSNTLLLRIFFDIV